ncbi:hypothetical protein D3C81_1113460 [compost metagenome]
MEATGRDVNLAVQAQAILILHHFQIALQPRFQTKGIQSHIVANVDHQVAVDRDPRRFRLYRFKLLIQHHFVGRDAHRAFRQFLYRNTRPRNVYRTIK